MRSKSFTLLTKPSLDKSYEFGRRLREARQRRKWSLEKAEEITGISSTTLVEIEKGSHTVAWGHYLVLLQVYGMISELDGLCHATKDFLAPVPQVHKSTSKVTFDDDLE